LSDLLSERRGNLVIFIPFCNINLLISFHLFFQDEKSLGEEEEVEHAGWEEDLEVARLEESFDGGHYSEEEEDEEGAGVGTLKTRYPTHTSSKSRQGAGRASTYYHASCSFGPHLHVEVGSGASTCPVAPDLTSLQR
jgi:hypothetical protein